MLVVESWWMLALRSAPITGNWRSAESTTFCWIEGWPCRTMPTTVSSTNSRGNTARNAAWEIWPVSRPAWSSEYLRTTAQGTAVSGWRC